MNLIEMTVDSGCTAALPYEFRASGGGVSNHKVTLIMPLGGVQSGLYRSPKKGDKVLVAMVDNGKTQGQIDSDDTFYLLGYVPDASHPFGVKNGSTDKTSDVVDSKGEVFRYQQTGKKTPPEGEAYSEIGFYHKETLWNAADEDKDTFVDNKDTKSGGYLHPKVDHINIHSTGDIHESAANHHRVQAQRLELLAGTTVDPNRNKGITAPDQISALQFGSVEWANPDDFKRGDMYIKAAKDITIEAEGSITLKVGRTILTITDAGFSVTNQLMTYVPNPMDASLSMNARDGVAIYGQKVSIESDHKWSISDKFGAGVTGTAGLVNMGGREISITGQNTTAQLAGNIAYGIDYIVRSTMGGIFGALPNTGQEGDLSSARQSEYWLDLIATVGEEVSSAWFLIAKYKKLSGKLKSIAAKTPTTPGGRTLDEANAELTRRYNVKLEAHAAATLAREEAMRAHEGDPSVVVPDDPGPVPAAPQLLSAGDPRLTTIKMDPSELFLAASYLPRYETLALCLEFLLSMTNEVYKKVLLFGAIKTAQDRDIFNLCSMAIDNGLILTFSSLMLASLEMEGSAGIALSYDGSVTVKTAKEQKFYAVTTTEAAGTVPLGIEWGFRAAMAAKVVSKIGTYAGEITNWVYNGKALYEAGDAEEETF